MQNDSLFEGCLAFISPCVLFAPKQVYSQYLVLPKGTDSDPWRLTALYYHILTVIQWWLSVSLILEQCILTNCCSSCPLPHFPVCLAPFSWVLLGVGEEMPTRFNLMWAEIVVIHGWLNVHLSDGVWEETVLVFGCPEGKSGKGCV